MERIVTSGEGLSCSEMTETHPIWFKGIKSLGQYTGLCNQNMGGGGMQLA